MYSEESFEIIKERMLNNLEYDIDKREGSFINDMYAPIASEFIKAYMEMDNVHSILFVEDALGEDLDKKVFEFGVPRKLGERAKGILTFKGDENTLVPRNMEVTTDGNFRYITISQGYIKNGFVDIEVEADLVGTKYNIEANTTWNLPTEIIINEVVNNNNFDGGINIESDDDLKKRFFEVVQNIRTSGNVNDYKFWSKEVVGVSNVDVYPLHAGNGTVKVVASGDNRLPLDEDTLINCRQHVLESCPIGATVTVITTSLFNVSIELAVNVDVDYNLVDVKKEIEKSIRDYIGICIDKIYYNKLAAKVLSCNGVIDYTILTVNGSTNSIINIPVDNVANIQAINITTSVGAYNE